MQRQRNNGLIDGGWFDLFRGDAATRETEAGSAASGLALAELGSAKSFFGGRPFDGLGGLKEEVEVGGCDMAPMMAGKAIWFDNFWQIVGLKCFESCLVVRNTNF